MVDDERTDSPTDDGRSSLEYLFAWRDRGLRGRPEVLDLLEDPGVALDGGRVVVFLEPDPAPDVVRLDWVGKSAPPVPELADLGAEPVVHVVAGRSLASSGRRSLFARSNFSLGEQFGLRIGPDQMNSTTVAGMSFVALAGCWME